MNNTLKARKIDICLCVKNRNNILEKLLDDITEMTKNLDCNIILVDGRSADETPRTLVNYMHIHNQNCIVAQVDENSTYVDAYNKALSLCVSQYICWIDSDDISKIDRLEILSSYLDENKEISVVGCSTYLPNSMAIINTMIDTTDEMISKALQENNEVSMRELLHFQSCMFRKECLKKFKNGIYFYPEYVGGYAGEGFLYVLHFNGFKFANISSTYYIYTKGLVPGSLTNTYEPVFANEINSLKYEQRKKEIMKLFRKHNKKQTQNNETDN